MPDIEPLMQEWPAEFEELLNQVIVDLVVKYVIKNQLLILYQD